MKLSENLTLAEMLRSESAKHLQIENVATVEHIENMKALAENVFQPIRSRFKRPIHISSGYRSKALNDAIRGSSKTSQHSKGEAMDIDMDNTEVTNLQIFNFIRENLIFDQLIGEFPNSAGNFAWVHVSFAKKNRGEVLIARKQGGKTIYIKL